MIRKYYDYKGLQEGGGDYESPYCPLCESCGYEGCCDYLQCFAKLIELNPKCDNGKIYLKDACFDKAVSNLAVEVIARLKNGNFEVTDTVEYYELEWHKIYNKFYKND